MWWIALRPRPEGPLQPVTAPEVLQPAPEGGDVWSVLAWRCLQLTPLVACCDGVLVMEVSGSVRLFGGQVALLRQLYMQNKSLALVEYAQGATSLVASGRLQAHSPLRVPWPAAALPVEVLAVARPHAALLARMGIRTWGQLRALPRGGLARRFGQPLLDALDRAWGDAPETYDWLQAPGIFAQRVELAASVDSAPGLLFAARRLLDALLAWLRARQQGVLALALVWELDARRANARYRDAHHAGGHSGQLVLRTAAPTQDMAHVQRLLAEHLARVQLPAPVLYLRLHSLQTAPMGGETHSLLAHTLRPGDALAPTLERLAARLGAQQVLAVQLQDDHRWEHMQRWAPHPAMVAADMPARRGAPARPRKGGGQDPAGSAPGDLLPPVLLDPPQPVAARRLCWLSGPHRCETGWWDAQPVLRDYYLARMDGLGLVGVYCERLRAGAGREDAQWFLHGVWG